MRAMLNDAAGHDLKGLESTVNRPTIYRNRPAGGLEQGARLSALAQRHTKTNALRQAVMQELLTGSARIA